MNKLQYWIELNRVKLFYKTRIIWIATLKGGFAKMYSPEKKMKD